MSLENLTHFGLRAGVDMRPTLVRVLTDLYVQKLTHRPDEERHYTELALRLLSAVDVPTRVAVARRLTRHMSPPLRIMRYLAADMPEVASLVRGHSVLQRSAEEPVAHHVEHPVEAAPIAEQVALAPEIHDVAPPQEREEQHEEEFRPAASAPGPIGTAVAGELNELFFASTADERRLILLNLEVAAPSAAERIQITRDVSVGPQLEAAVLSGNREEFTRHLAQFLQIPRIQARRIAADDLGEPMVTAAKALKIPRDVLYRILLFANAAIGHSVERVHALATLYDEMPTAAAEHMVSIWQSLHAEDRVRAQYQSLFWNDERSRARTATATVRRAPAAQPQRPRERRDAS